MATTKLLNPPLLLAALTLALAACNAERPADTTPAADQPVAEQPATEAPAAPTPPPSPPPADGPAPAAGTITYTGFGPAGFGANQEAVRMAWGKDMKADAPMEAGGCHYLFPQPRPASGYGTAFMFEGDKLARIDVDRADAVAPGGGRIGMSTAEIRHLYAGQIEERAHKYVDGAKYLRIKDPNGGNGVLVFETDAAGKVEEWRVGVAPNVDYVEGCS